MQISKEDRELLTQAIELKEEVVGAYQFGFLDGYKCKLIFNKKKDKTIWLDIHDDAFKSFTKRYKKGVIKTIKQQRRTKKNRRNTTR